MAYSGNSDQFLKFGGGHEKSARLPGRRYGAGLRLLVLGAGRRRQGARQRLTRLRHMRKQMGEPPVLTGVRRAAARRFVRADRILQGRTLRTGPRRKPWW